MTREEKIDVKVNKSDIVKEFMTASSEDLNKFFQDKDIIKFMNIKRKDETNE